jgi:vitamin B12 transporter
MPEYFVRSLRHSGVIALAFITAFSKPSRAQQPAQTLDTIVVVASRAGTTKAATASRSVQVITREDIGRSAAHTVSDLLSNVMGVDVYGRSPAQADVSIRGSTAEQVVVLVDGVRMTDVQSGHYTMDLAVPLASIERIEILRGAGSALYGPDAVGGVINIVTRSATPASVSVLGGSFGTIGGAISGDREQGAHSLSIAAQYDKSDGHRDGTDFRMGQGRATFVTPVMGGALATDAAIGVRDFGAANFYAPFNSIERTATSTLGSRWNGDIAGWGLSLNASTRRHEDHYVLIRGNPAVYENHHETWETAGTVSARRDVGRAAIAIGGESAHDQLSSGRLGGRREWRVGAFGEATVATSVATANVGLRDDHSSTYGDFFSPTVSAGVQATNQLHLRGNVGLGYRAPTWTERFYTDPSNMGDPGLRPERFGAGELGARVSTNAAAFDLTAFERHATHLIDWVRPAGSPATAVWQATNVGNATYRGIEATVEPRPIAGFTAAVYATGLNFEASEPSNTPIEGKYALRPLTRQIGVRVGTPTSHAISARLEMMEAQRAGESGYVTGNIRLACACDRYRLTLDALNLTNAVWLDASGMPSARRGVYLGVQWR